jgi:cytochrome c biogenesis protein CcdA
MSPADAGLAFLAGLLTVLSPCVLPILPIVFAGAAGRHRLGPLVLAAGVAVSFTAAGLFLATVGFSLGLDADRLRPVFGGLLVIFGLALLLPRLQAWVEAVLSPLAGWASGRMDRAAAAGLVGQFAIGALLGLVWSPCVGPTLGAASLLASRGENLPQVAAVMAVFAIGASLPLLCLGLLSRSVLGRVRGGLNRTGRWGRYFLGGAMVAAGLLVVSGVDRSLETVLATWSPDWLASLTTRF